MTSFKRFTPLSKNDISAFKANFMKKFKENYIKFLKSKFSLRLTNNKDNKIKLKNILCLTFTTTVLWSAAFLLYFDFASAYVGSYPPFSYPIVNSGSAVVGGTLTFKANVKNTGAAQENISNPVFIIDICDNGDYEIYCDGDIPGEADIILSAAPSSAIILPNQVIEFISEPWINIPAGKHRVKFSPNFTGGDVGNEKPLVLFVGGTSDVQLTGNITYNDDVATAVINIQNYVAGRTQLYEIPHSTPSGIRITVINSSSETRILAPHNVYRYIALTNCTASSPSSCVSNVLTLVADKSPIDVRVFLNDEVWSGPINFSLTGPSTNFSETNISTAKRFSSRSEGLYTLIYNSGGPSGAIFDGISHLSNGLFVMENESGNIIPGSTHQMTIWGNTETNPHSGWTDPLIDDTFVAGILNLHFSLHTLTVTNPNTAGNISGSGINCGNGGTTCSKTFANGTSVTLTASPNSNAGYSHGTWGGSCSGTTSANCPLIMNADKLASVSFTASNNPPIAQAGISKDGVDYSDTITVSPGETFDLYLSAAGSSDPDGWTSSNGVSSGLGKCEWGHNINHLPGATMADVILGNDSDGFDTTVITQPPDVVSCNYSLNNVTVPASYVAENTYLIYVLSIIDAQGGVGANVVFIKISSSFSFNNPPESARKVTNPGWTSDYTISIAREVGFTDTVTLSSAVTVGTASDLIITWPDGNTITNIGSQSKTMRVQAKNAETEVKRGFDYNIRVTGTAGSDTKTSDVSLHINQRPVANFARVGSGPINVGDTVSFRDNGSSDPDFPAETDGDNVILFIADFKGDGITDICFTVGGFIPSCTASDPRTSNWDFMYDAVGSYNAKFIIFDDLMEYPESVIKLAVGDWTEAMKSMNFITLPITVTALSEPSLPDLTISVDPSLNSGILKEGEVLTFKATVRNQGGANVSVSFKNHFQVDVNNDGSVDYDLNPDADINSLISGDEETVVSGNWTAEAGTHRIIVCADSSDKIMDESDETNNCSPSGSGLITVPPSLALSFIANPASGLFPLFTTLTAEVTGSAQGTTNYSFWWDCDNTTTSVQDAIVACGNPNSPSVGAKFDNEVSESISADHTYTAEKVYKAKIIVERDTLAAQKIISINTACVDECSSSQCVAKGPPGKFKTCGNYDDDSCLELSPNPTSCGAGQTCIDGVCKLVPVISFNAVPPKIKKDDSSTVSWDVQNVDDDDCTASNSENSPQFTGVKSASGSASVSPTVNTEYTLTCVNVAGTASQTVTVEIDISPGPGEF